MTYLILIAISLILLGGFLLLTAFERGRGLRVAGNLRNRFDAKVARVSFIVRHVDWGAFVKHLAATVFERAAHDIAHTVLLLVRSLERLLTRTVKYLRARRGDIAALAEEEPDSGRLDRAVMHVREAFRKARAAARGKRRARAQKQG